MTRRFESLSPLEVMALAIRIEQCNVRRLLAFADAFRGYDSVVTARFEELADEERGHEKMLTDHFHERFGSPIPLVEEAEVEGVIESFDLDDAEHLIFDSLDPAHVYELILHAEQVAEKFYQLAAAQSKDLGLHALYSELARIEGQHAAWVDAKRTDTGSPGGGR